MSEFLDAGLAAMFGDIGQSARRYEDQQQIDRKNAEAERRANYLEALAEQRYQEHVKQQEGLNRSNAVFATKLKAPAVTYEKINDKDGNAALQAYQDVPAEVDENNNVTTPATRVPVGDPIPQKTFQAVMHGNVMTSLNTATGKFGPESRTVGTLSPAGMGKPVQDPDSETGWSYQNRDGTLTKNAPIPPGQRGNVGQSQASDDKLRARIMNPKTADAELAGMANDAGMMQSVETPVGSGHYVPAQFGPDAKLTNAQRFDLYKTVSTQRSGGLAGAAGVKAPSPVQATSDHGKIVRTGTDKATGKKVVQYEDGTIGPAT